MKSEHYHRTNVPAESVIGLNSNPSEATSWATVHAYFKNQLQTHHFLASCYFFNSYDNVDDSFLQERPSS
jgi:hypothetical protein